MRERGQGERAAGYRGVGDGYLRIAYPAFLARHAVRAEVPMPVGSGVGGGTALLGSAASPRISSGAGAELS